MWTSSLRPFLPPDRGYVYCSQEVEAGWVVWVDGHLLHRAHKSTDERETEIFCKELDPNTLKVIQNNL